MYSQKHMKDEEIEEVDVLILNLQNRFGRDWLKYLNWDQVNKVCSSLGYNRFPTYTNHGRPIRWELKLNKTDDEKPKKRIC